MIKGVDHIAITVSDMGKSVEFYTKILGLEEVMRLKSKIPGIKEIAFLKSQNTMLELLAIEKPEKHAQEDLMKVGVKHLCFGVEDIAKEVERIKSLGIKMVEERHVLNAEHLETISSKLKNVDIRRGLERAVFADPDGILIEVAEWK
ncbi:MAG: VOC family protein [Methanomassiliicoccales archaeon]|nr:VOC family protein [Methanomassiliicoccales archaeon]